MRVRNIETNIKPRQNIIVAGMDGYSAGMPDFKPGLHFIRPDGNSASTGKELSNARNKTYATGWHE